MNHYAWVLPAEAAFSLADCLAESCIFEGENGNWHVDYYCPLDQKPDQRILSQYAGYVLTVLPDQDWVAHAAGETPPLVVGDFYIHTPHYPPSGAHPFQLCIDTNMAFGSGHHATTQGCIQLIQDVWAKGGWEQALDFGCGSGILACAMNRIAPGSAMGIDCDGDAVRLANENALHNDCPSVFMVADCVPAGHTFDFIVANVYAPVLIALAPTFSGARHIILSGILQIQAAGVIKAYEALGWTLEKTIESAEWASLWLRK
jgi:ribosomal protein L11 methyltransferase